MEAHSRHRKPISPPVKKFKGETATLAIVAEARPDTPPRDARPRCATAPLSSFPVAVSPLASRSRRQHALYYA